MSVSSLQLMKKSLAGLALLAALLPPALFAADITALRSWRAPDNTRLVLDLSGPLKYRVSPDSTPARLIVELDDAQLTAPLNSAAAVGPLKSIRLEKNGNGQRLVIDTTVELSPRIFQLPPNEKYGHRLVLDLYDKPAAGLAAGPVEKAVEKPAEKTPETVAAAPDALEKLVERKPEVAAPVTPAVPATPAKPVTTTEKPAAEKSPAEKTIVEKKPVEVAAPRPEPEKFDPKRYRNVIIAIDPGHGGEDPGASGANGTHEKDVTLSIARELQAQLNAEPGLTAVLTRTGDYFIPLQERRRVARYQHKADIFVSIHADAAPSRAAKGASVFALSLKGANSATSRFARMLAERENRADLIGGAALENGDDVLRNVLADMVVAGSLEHSLHMGRNILGGLDRVGTLHSQRVEQAGFAVLKEPGMVSLLVETGFISNPDEEKKLVNKDYQRQLAKAVFDGVRRYCIQYPAPGTYFAWLADKDRVPAVAADSAAKDVKRDVLAAATDKKPEEKKAADKKPAESKPRYVKHKVVRGENLTRLAAQYQVSMATLRELNSLRDDNVR
ncbi:MAG TPA: N-acetylmuramoyl-L-alanine amidase, partial [Moraxellaceae bacterium]